jgi:hypothetical protein
MPFRNMHTYREYESPPSHIERKVPCLNDLDNSNEKPDNSKAPDYQGNKEADCVDNVAWIRDKRKGFGYRE